MHFNCHRWVMHTLCSVCTLYDSHCDGIAYIMDKLFIYTIWSSSHLNIAMYPYYPCMNANIYLHRLDERDQSKRPEAAEKGEQGETEVVFSWRAGLRLQVGQEHSNTSLNFLTLTTSTPGSWLTQGVLPDEEPGHTLRGRADPFPHRSSAGRLRYQRWEERREGTGRFSYLQTRREVKVISKTTLWEGERATDARCSPALRVTDSPILVS